MPHDVHVSHRKRKQQHRRVLVAVIHIGVLRRQDLDDVVVPSDEGELKGRAPPSVAASIFARCSSSSRTTSAFPPDAAEWSGVYPSFPVR